MYLKSLWMVPVIVGTTSCSQGDDASQIVSQCPASARLVLAGQENCFGGDPAVLARLPAWAKPPTGVRIRSTGFTRSKIMNTFGYRGEFRGRLSKIEPVYRAQLRSAPEMKPRYQGKIFVADIPGNINSVYVTLTEQSTSTGNKLVEIDVAAGPVWKAGEPRPWATED